MLINEHGQNVRITPREFWRRLVARSLRCLTRMSGRGDRVINAAYHHLGGRPRTMMATKVNGIAISCNLEDSIGHRLYYRGKFEPGFSRLLLAELSAGDVFLDVGANCGYFSLSAARIVGPSGVVHAFEPAEGPASRLLRDADRNRLQNLKIHSCALGAIEGRAVLAIGSDSTSPEGTRHLAPTGAGTSVRVVALDAFLPHLRPSVIKIDVEGSELAALRGMSRILLQSRPRLVTVEAVASHLSRFGTTPEDVEEFMREHGYSGQVYEEDGYDRILIFRQM